MCVPAEPWWFRERLLPHLELPVDLPLHFIDEKVVTATDLDPQQDRFRLPSYGVLRNLRPILTAKELQAANLRYEDDNASTAEEQGRIRKKRKEKKHGGGGLPVLVVDASAGISELQLSRWDCGRGTIIKGEEYLDFISHCSFTVHDVVQIWAFKHHASRFNVAESPLYVVFSKKPKP